MAVDYSYCGDFDVCINSAADHNCLSDDDEIDSTRSQSPYNHDNTDYHHHSNRKKNHNHPRRRKFKRERSLSETSSEEGYFTSTSPDITTQREDTGVFKLRFGNNKTLLPLSVRDPQLPLEGSPRTMMKAPRGGQIDFENEGGRKQLETLGLSPRMVFPKRSQPVVMSSSGVTKYGQPPPPGSPSHPKRPVFKGLSSLVGSLNNLASIPELEREATEWRPVSRRQRSTLGGSYDNLVSLGTADRPQKSKPHHVPPMSRSHRIKIHSVSSDNYFENNERLVSPKHSQEEYSNWHRGHTRESHDDKTEMNRSKKRLFREKSRDLVLRDNDNDERVYKQTSGNLHHLKDIPSKLPLNREHSNDFSGSNTRNTTMTLGRENSEDLLSGNPPWQLFRERSNYSIKNGRSSIDKHGISKEDTVISEGDGKLRKKKDRSRKKQNTHDQ